MGERYADADQDKDMDSVGGRIRWARKRQGLTQEQLANAFPSAREKKRAVIGQYESGGILPSLDVICDLAAILDEEPGFLAFGTTHENVGHTVQGRSVELTFHHEQPNNPEHMLLPWSVLHAFDCTSSNLKLTRLDVSYRPLNYGVGDYLLYDASCSRVIGDGSIYVVKTTSGVAIIQSEASLINEGLDCLHITLGNGANITAPLNSVESLGRLMAVMQKAAE